MAHSRTGNDARGIAAVERRQQAFEARRLGATYKDIGRLLGCSEQRAHQIITAEMKRRRAKLADVTDDVIAMELERLDAMFMGAFPRAQSGDTFAIKACLEIMARRARLLGLDSPEKVETEHTYKVRKPDDWPEWKDDEVTKDGDGSNDN